MTLAKPSIGASLILVEPLNLPEAALEPLGTLRDQWARSRACMARKDADSGL